MSADRALTNNSSPSLQLLLFLDERMTSYVQNLEIRNRLADLDREQSFELQIVDVGKQPDLAEHYRVIATPALVKLYPPPRQILAGSNLIDQIDNWWERWQGDIAAARGEGSVPYTDYPEAVEIVDRRTERAILSDSIGYVSKLIELTDEVFALKQEKEELLNRLKLQDRAISVLAHDLRNPLTAAALALGTLEIIHNPLDYRANSLEPVTIKKLIERARVQLQSIDRLVNDILQPLTNTNSELSLRPQKLSLARLITDVISQLDDRIQVKSQTITTDIPQDLPSVYGDGDKLAQALINLLDNAIKYTPMRGQIHVSALHRTAQTIQVSIADNGLGIPEDDRQRIFQDRYRLDRDLLESGYGIGLAVCQQIVRAHYGQIWVESVPGKGSVFNFTLLVYQ
jgi:two-component system, OmpR family, clock-associated histidine kinase SasA